MKELMCNYVFKVPGSNNYQFRRKIPQDLISHYNKKEIKKSLRTSDKREAEVLSRLEASRLDAEWESIRSKVSSNHLALIGADEALSVESADVHVRPKYVGDEVWTKEAKLVREKVKASLPLIHPNNVEARSYFYLSIAREQATLARKYGLYEDYLSRVQSSLLDREEMLRTGDAYYLGEDYYEAPHVSEAIRNGYQAFLTGTGPTIWFNSAQLNTSVAIERVIDNKVSVSIFSLVEKWAAERTRNQKTVDMYNRTATRFCDLVGFKPIQEIKRADVVRFKEELLKLGQTAANTNKQLIVVNTLLNYAKANALIDVNLASGVSIKVERKEKPRVAFDAEALNAIFSSPIYQEDYRPKAGAGQAAYWLPLLALFTGARLEELGQLHPSDILEESYYAANGDTVSAWVIRIKHSDEDGQGVKNFGSNRRVPVHAELIRLGFLSYALQAKKENKARIFDKLTADKYGTETAQYSKWFNRYLREKCKVSNKRMTFHSFRHAFKDYCRLAGIDVGDQLTGHVSGSVGDSYGADLYPLHPLVSAVKRYRVLGLDLSVLKPAA